MLQLPPLVLCAVLFNSAAVLTLMVPTQSKSESPAGKADTPSPLLAIRPISSCCSRLVTAPVSRGRAASGALPLLGLAAGRAAAVLFMAAATAVVLLPTRAGRGAVGR